MPNLVSITPWSPHSIGAAIIAVGGTTLPSTASAAYPLANLAIFVPFALEDPYDVTQMFVINGATVGGNVDVGIYAEDGTCLRAKGTTAQAGTSVPQTFNIDDITLPPGQYYMAVALDVSAGTPTLFRGTFGGAATVGAFCGIAEQTSAFPLPMAATLATFATANYIPLIGITGRSLV